MLGGIPLPPIGFVPNGLAAAYTVVQTGSLGDHGLTPMRDGKARLLSGKALHWSCDKNGRMVGCEFAGGFADQGDEFAGALGVTPPPPILFNERVWRINDSTFGFTWGLKGRPHPSAEILMFAARPIPPRTSVYIWHVMAGTVQCDPNKFVLAQDVAKLSIVKFGGSKFPNHALFMTHNSIAEAQHGYFTDLWTPDPADSTMVIRGVPPIDR